MNLLKEYVAKRPASFTFFVSTLICAVLGWFIFPLTINPLFSKFFTQAELFTIKLYSIAGISLFAVIFFVIIPLINLKKEINGLGDKG